MADAPRLEVDQGDAAGFDDEPVDDAEGARVGEMLLGQHGARPKEDLANLRLAQEAVDRVSLFFSQAGRGCGILIRAQPGQRRVDAQAALDPLLHGGGAQRRVHLLRFGPGGGISREIRRRQLLADGRLPHFGTVIPPPAALRPFGVRQRLFDGPAQPFTEPLQPALPVGPQEDRQAPDGPGRRHVQEVGRLPGPLFPCGRHRLHNALRPLHRPGFEKRKLHLVQADRTAVFRVRDLGQPVALLLPEEKHVRELEALGGVYRGQLHPARVLAFGDGDQMRHLQHIAEERSRVDGVGPVEIPLRLVPERFDEDAREKGAERAQCGGKGCEAVRPGHRFDGPRQLHDPGCRRLAMAERRKGARNEAPVMRVEKGGKRKEEGRSLA